MRFTVRSLTLLLVTFGLSGASGVAGPRPAEKGRPMQSAIEKRDFGKTADGTPVDLFVLRNSAGMTTKIMTYGGIVTELHVPDREGKVVDVVLGFDSLDKYLAGHPYFGALIGRVANRIAKGQFTLDGKEYHVPINNGPNSLHGGLKGFDKVVWEAKPDPSGVPALTLSHHSSDGDQGYPGDLSVTVRYSLAADANELRIDYQATTDRPTPVNLTHHSYFNLAGPASGDILGHVLMIAADAYTPVDDRLIPTGAIKPVRGTPLDFTTPQPIGARIGQLKGDPGGYDHNYVLRKAKAPPLAARVEDPRSGRVMEVYTTEPGLQFYSGNFLDGKLTGKGGVVYRKHQGFCLEAQHFPDAVHHPNFPSIILRPGQTETQTTVYRFLAR